jgi:hypothetical protein
LRFRHHHQTPTLIDCKFLKNSALLAEAFCSAAEKEDYGAFRFIRQPLFFLRLACATDVQQRGDRIIAAPAPRLQD